MIVKASAPMLRGAQLGPVIRGIVPRHPHRARVRAGMGALVDDQISGTLQSFEAGLPFQAQAGTETSADDFRSAILYQLANTCNESSTPGVDCPGGLSSLTPKVDQAVAAYAAALAAAKANAAAYFAANTPAAQPAPAPVVQPQVSTPVQSNAPAAAVALPPARPGSPTTISAPGIQAQLAAPITGIPPMVAAAPVPIMPTAVQSNAPAAAVVIPGVATGGFSLTGTAFTIPFLGTESGGYAVPWWGVFVVGGGLAWFLFSRKR